MWLDDRPVAVLGAYQGEKIQYVLADHLGTPRAVVNPATDAIIWRWDLTGSAFGSHAGDADPDGDGANDIFNLRYPGQYADESGLHYNYFRDYDPATGRYVQSDPIGLWGGISTYAYAEQRPIQLTDSFGLQAARGGRNPWNAYQQSNGGRGLSKQDLLISYRQGQLNRLGQPTLFDLHNEVLNLPDMKAVWIMGLPGSETYCNAYGFCYARVRVCTCGPSYDPTPVCYFGPSHQACYCTIERRQIN